MPALAETDLGILDDYCKSNDSSLRDVYGRMGDLGERFGLAEFMKDTRPKAVCSTQGKRELIDTRKDLLV